MKNREEAVTPNVAMPSRTERSRSECGHEQSQAVRRRASCRATGTRSRASQRCSSHVGTQAVTTTQASLTNGGAATASDAALALAPPSLALLNLRHTTQRRQRSLKALQAECLVFLDRSKWYKALAAEQQEQAAKMTQ